MGFPAHFERVDGSVGDPGAELFRPQSVLEDSADHPAMTGHCEPIHFRTMSASKKSFERTQGASDHMIRFLGMKQRELFIRQRPSLKRAAKVRSKSLFNLGSRKALELSEVDFS